MLMMIILAALFILTPMFRKKENEKTKIEREYFEILKNLKENGKNCDEIDEKTKEKLSHCIKSIYGEVSVSEFLKRDLESF